MLALGPVRMRGAVIAPCSTPDVNPTVMTPACSRATE
jgi:hypothetical protein